ncbi:hypothetical protein K502DRAFT_324096, partial [Neoconidiobolus thromboides FSU 785]
MKFYLLILALLFQFSVQQGEDEGAIGVVQIDASIDQPLGSPVSISTKTVSDATVVTQVITKSVTSKTPSSPVETQVTTHYETTKSGKTDNTSTSSSVNSQKTQSTKPGSSGSSLLKPSFGLPLVLFLVLGSYF